MTIKIAIASFAHVHAQGYLRILRQMPGVQVLCADPDGYVEDFEGADFVRSFDEMFAWEPDAVVVCNENARHRQLVEAAAAHGCHVLCEKPLATTVEDGEAMVKACKEAGVILMTAYPVRFAPQYQDLQGWTSEGLLGQMITAWGANNGRIPVGTRKWFTDPELSGGGALVDHVVHVADLLDGLVGGELPASVQANTNQILHSEKPEVAAETGGMVTLTYPSGFTAVIDCSWSQPDDAPVWGGLNLEVLTSSGKVWIDPFAQRVDGFSQLTKQPLWESYGENLDELMLATFIEGIISGVAPQPDGEAGLRTTKIMCAAMESAKTGVPVKL